MVDLSIIIVNWNTKQLLLDCIGSILTSTERATFEVIVVDNGSTDGSIDAVAARYPDVRIIANIRNVGFGPANNMGIKHMQGRYAVLLNSDTVVKGPALDRLFDFMETHPDVGICGPQLLNADGSKQTSFGAFPTLASEFASRSLIRIFAPTVHARLFSNAAATENAPGLVDFIIGACMVARKEAINAAGTLDEDYFFFYEEIDWCWRMRRAGWPVYHVPDAEIYHLSGASTRAVSFRARVESWRSRYLYFRKSLSLGIAGTTALHLVGLIEVLYQFLIYTLLNIATLFSLSRLRRRWGVFSYLLAWHASGCPISMGLRRTSR